MPEFGGSVMVWTTPPLHVRRIGAVGIRHVADHIATVVDARHYAEILAEADGLVTQAVELASAGVGRGQIRPEDARRGDVTGGNALVVDPHHVAILHLGIAIRTQDVDRE